MMTNGNEKRPLPEGWTWTKVNQVADIISGKTPKGINDFGNDGEIDFYKVSDMNSPGNEFFMTNAAISVSNDVASKLKLRVCDKGTVIFPKRGGAIATNKKRILSKPSAYDLNVMGLSPKIPFKYLYYWLESIDLATLGDGSNVPQINNKDIVPLDFPLAPKDEQERIVAEIEKQFTRLDQAVASLRRLQSNLARYKASVLKAACEGRLVPQDPADEPAGKLLERILAERRAQWQAANPGKTYKEPVGVEETAVLPALPEGWVWTNMETLIVDGPTNGLYLPKSKYGEGVPILRIDDYQNGESRSSDELRKVAANAKEIQKFSLRKRDMVINRVNSPSHLGKCLVIEDRNLPSLFESNMMRMALSENVRPDFIEFYLQSGNGRARLISNAKWAVNQASINQGDVMNTPVPLPPLAEQERIVAEVERRLSVVTAVEQTITANLSRAERLRQSILHRAFTGQLV